MALAKTVVYRLIGSGLVQIKSFPALISHVRRRPSCVSIPCPCFVPTCHTQMRSAQFVPVPTFVGFLTFRANSPRQSSVDTLHVFDFDYSSGLTSSLWNIVFLSRFIVFTKSVTETLSAATWNLVFNRDCSPSLLTRFVNFSTSPCTLSSSARTPLCLHKSSNHFFLYDNAITQLW